MDSLLVFLLGLASLGCAGSSVPGQTDAQGLVTIEPPPASWQARVELVRADLQQIELAHQTKDRDAVFAAWGLAYLEHFEPLLERPLAGVADPHAIMSVEYQFGRLLSVCESPRAGPFQAAVTDLSLALSELEQQVLQLPAPPAG